MINIPLFIFVIGMAGTFILGVYLSPYLYTEVSNPPPNLSLPINPTHSASQHTDISCETDNDCILINRNTNYRECFPGACTDIDYSLGGWVARNKESFDGWREQESRFAPQNCGPAPACPVVVINDYYVAKCINNACEKMFQVEV